MKHSTSICLITTGILTILGAQPALAQNTQGDQVSRKEYESLKRDFDAMKLQLDKLTSQPDSIAKPEAESTSFAIQRADQRLTQVEETLLEMEDGESSFHLTGYGYTNYAYTEGADTDFSASLVPIILWELSDRILFETELEISLSNPTVEGETNIELGYAHGSYIVNDFLTVGAGKFLTPFGIFGERLHPAWINKLPNAPMAFSHHGGLTPMASIGAYARGGFAMGDSKANYAFYVSNGPTLNTGHHGVGTLNYTNFNDANNNKGIGGRIGFLPIPELELGYSFLHAAVAPSGFGNNIDALVQGIDVSYITDSEYFGGLFDFRFEKVFSDVDDTLYVPAPGDPVEPLFDNKRNGGYVQLAYRPIYSEMEFLRTLEVVGRYGWVDHPGGSSDAFDTQRKSVGVNYWFDHSSVLKLSYQKTSTDGAADVNAFIAQVAFGF